MSQINYHHHAALTVGNRADDPLQKVGNSSSVVAYKNTGTPLPRRCWREVWLRGGGMLRGWPWGSGSHTNSGLSLLEGGLVALL